MISFSDFQKVEMKVGKVESVEKIPGADKLYKIVVDTGEKRTIVGGVAEQYTAEDLVGKEIVVVTNLEPRKIRGIDSNGMLLAAVEPSGKISIVVPMREVEPGTGVQ